MPDPDLLIRTAGEMRISNFLLWQISYAELWITQKCWPEFDESDLHAAINDYAKRDRRFGGLNIATQSPQGSSHATHTDALAGKIISPGLQSRANCF